MLKTLRNNEKRKKKGFTLIELIIVIAIIGVLALIAIPRFGAARRNANISADIANAKTIHDTTARLIAEGGITLPTGTNTTVIDPEATGNLNTALQTVPTPRVTTTDHFVVRVNAAGDIEVFSSDAAGALTNQIEVYPNGADPYNQ